VSVQLVFKLRSLTSSETAVSLKAGRTARWLAIPVVALTLAGLMVAISEAYLGAESMGMRALTDWFGLDGEGNLIAWFSSTLFVACSAFLFVEAARRRRQQLSQAGGWWWLGALFVFLAIDEAVVIHERVGSLLEPLELPGFLSFSWVIPAALAVLIGSFLIRPLLASATPDFRRRAVRAAVLYVGGAIGFESLSALFSESLTVFSLPYILAATVEEGLEMTGLAYFLVACIRMIAETAGSVRVDLTA